MCLDGGFADEQMCGDIGVGQASRQKGENFPLAGVSWAIFAGVNACFYGRVANSSINRRVTAGSNHASPQTTARIAATISVGAASLSRKPGAPMRSAA